MSYGTIRATDLRHAARLPSPPVAVPPFLYLGLDLGQANDVSALTIAEHNRLPAKYRVGHLQRFALKTPYPAIVAEVAALVRQLAPRDPRPRLRLAVDKTGVGAPVADLLRAEHLSADLLWVTIANLRRGLPDFSREGNAGHCPRRETMRRLRRPASENGILDRRLLMVLACEKPCASHTATWAGRHGGRRLPGAQSP